MTIIEEIEKRIIFGSIPFHFKVFCTSKKIIETKVKLKSETPNMFPLCSVGQYMVTALEHCNIFPSQRIITIPLRSVGAMNGAERNADDSMASENIVFRVINRPQVNNISYRFPV